METIENYTFCVTVPTNKSEQLKRFENALSLWSLKKILFFSTYFCQMNLFPVHHSSCKLVFYYLSFAYWDLEKDREGLRFMYQDSDLSSISRKGPAPAVGGASPTWRSVSMWGTLPLIIISRAMAPRRRWATILTSLFTIRQFHSYLTST